MSENNGKIEIIQGNGKNLDISKVSEHLSISKPKMKENNGKIIIPGKQDKK